MLKQQLLKDLKKAISGLGYEATDIVLTIPKNSTFGDYTTNIALQLAKLKSGNGKQTSQEIASEIVDRVKSQESSGGYLEKAEVAGGGFINFFIKDQELVENLKTLCNDASDFKIETKDKDKKIIVEYTDPNPFKEFHIGHLFSNSVGESLARLLQTSGAQIKRANYFGDVGMHVAKSVWGLEQKLEKENLSLNQLEEKSLFERIQYLGEAYVLGAGAYEEQEIAKEQIKQVNFLIYIAAQKYLEETSDYKPKINYRTFIEIDEDRLARIQELYNKGKEWSLSYFETIYAKLGTNFDLYYPESTVAEYGIEQVRENLGKVFEKSEGAVIFPGEKYGLHRRVFINSLGLPTYEAKELGLAIKKYEDYPYDRSIVVTGNEIKEYFQVLMKALSEIRPDLSSKTVHIPHGMVRMIGGKISSRKGNVLTFEWLFESVKEKVSGLMKDSNMEDEEKEKVIEAVSVGAIKFSMLKSSPHMDTIFDLDKSVSLDGDSGPYLQYSYARAKSVLRNANYAYAHLEIKHKLEAEERNILRSIEYFEQIVEEAASNLHPNTVATYLADFAKQFNLFYQKHPIIKAETEKSKFRLALTCAVAAVLKKGLYLLGIEAPERM